MTLKKALRLIIMKISTNGEYWFQNPKIRIFCKMLGERCETRVPL